MRFTPRRRVVLALLAFTPLAYYYVFFNSFVAVNLGRFYRSGFSSCDGSWRSYFNSCDSATYSTATAWAEIIGSTLLLAAVAYGLARWALAPLRDVATSVSQFGPTSIGLRLRASGPRDETRALSDAIDTMLDRLAEGYEAQRRFASTASHELRTPLATQRALIEVSLGSALTPDQLDLLTRQLLATNERNERLIDGLLTLAETERGLMTTATVPLDVIAAEALEPFRSLGAEREISIRASLVPVAVVGERALLERLVGNLVHNAVKYNVAGGTVDVWTTAQGALVVANTGPVVPADQVGLLFEPFRRLSGERLDHGGGAGLGLTIARSIVAAHGGSIDARANPDGGLTVTVGLRPA